MKKFILLSFVILQAQDLPSCKTGVLDKTFAGIGYANVGNGTLIAMGRQSDGTIIACGYTYTPSNYLLLVAYDSQGNIKTSFAGNGRVVALFGEGDETNGFALHILPDDSILIAGYIIDGAAKKNFAVIKYTSTGQLDINFGNNGVAATNFGGGSNDVAYALVVQSDGKIVLGGLSNDGVRDLFGLARFTKEGILDTTFGGGGTGYVQTAVRSLISETPRGDTIFGLELQSDQKIVAVGYSNESGNKFDSALVRYTKDGVVDNTFGVNGACIHQFASGKHDQLKDVKILSDDSIIAVGYGKNASSVDTGIIVKYTKDGDLDTTFNETGYSFATIVGNDQFWRCILQKDGKILVAGLTYIGSSALFLVRYNSSGSLDTSFGDQGFIATKLTEDGDYISDVFVDNKKTYGVGSYGSGSGVIVCFFNHHDHISTLKNQESAGAL